MAATLKEASNLKATLNHPTCFSWHNTTSLCCSAEAGVHEFIFLTGNTKQAMHPALMAGALGKARSSILVYCLYRRQLIWQLALPDAQCSHLSLCS